MNKKIFCIKSRKRIDLYEKEFICFSMLSGFD
nr:MAG TPA: hypothetical protein [Caudoviricetes sp.]